PESSGLTSGVLKDTVVLPFNDIEEVRRRVEGEQLAAVIVEPVLGAGGCVPAEREFLQELRELCSDKGTLLIFDEVITGFRLSPGGAQQYYGVLPDITALGKILGGGFPVGAIAGRVEIMEHMDALMYERQNLSFHGGTFCANPVTTSAGLATLRTLEDGRLLHELNTRGDYVRQQLSDIFEKHSLEVRVTGVSSLFHTHFTKEGIKDIHDVFGADREKLLHYHMHLIANGVFFLPTKMAALSTAHTKEDIDKSLKEAEDYAKGV
ncbi:MAG: aspartate aminotransferase family protein, partial [Candidatus Bathyarchaeia archaeon]